MNQKSNKDKYLYEFAIESDGEEIADLLEQTTFDSDIALSYARRPNAYNSIKKESEKFAIITAKDIQTKKIVGVGICLINKLLINGKPENVAYLGGLRVNDGVSVNIIKCYQLLGQFCRENKVKYAYTTIIKDNQQAIQMLTKKRKTMPLYIKHSDYIVNIFRKNLKYSSENKCCLATENDFDKLYEFIKKESIDKVFFPYLTKESLKNGFFDLTYKDFYILKNQSDEILCCGVLWKQWDYKQAIIKNYSPKYKIIKSLASPILSLTGYPKPPSENEVIKYPTLSFVLSKNKDPNYMEDFTRQVSYFIPTECEFFTYAATADTIESQRVLEITPVNYKSIVYLVDWNKLGAYKDLLNQNIYVECGLL